MTESTEGIICPTCGHLHLDELHDSVDYWDSATEWTCDKCGTDFHVTTEVVRTWYAFTTAENR